MVKSTKILLLPALLILGNIVTAHGEDDKANSFSTALDKMCNKTTQCMVEQLKQDEIPLSMAEGMIQQIEMQCKQSMSFASQMVDQTMYKKAEACIEQMSESTCDELMNEPEWPACTEYEEYIESLDM